jgi:hypothetical protein
MMMNKVDWFKLLIACSLLLAVIAVLVVLEASFSRNENKEIPNYEIPKHNTINISNLTFNNTVVITNDYNTIVRKNEATEYAKHILINALTTNKHDSIKQYKPVHFYHNDKDITDMLEYHSLIDVKTLAIAVRIMLVNNSNEELHITNMAMKSEEYKDLFLLPIDLTLQPYQKTYIIWYISIAGENITEQGISQLLQSLAYAKTQYKHPIIKDIVLLDGYGNPLFHFITLTYKTITIDGNNNSNDNGHGLELQAILKNNSAKEYKVKTIAVRNTNNDYVFAYDLAEELAVPAYANVTIKVRIA